MSPLRLLLFRAHRWLGFGLALYFAVVFATGAILVLAEDVDALLHPASLGGGPRTPVETAFPAYLDHLTATRSGAVVARIVRPDAVLAADWADIWQPGGFTKLWLQSDPVAVRAERGLPGAMEYVLTLHESLFLPGRAGYLAVTASSAILAVLVLAGLVTYRRFWHGFLRPPPRAGTARMRQAGWHRLAGLWSAPFLLIIAATGAMFFLISTGLMPVQGVTGRVSVDGLAAIRPTGEGLARAMAAAGAAVPGLEINAAYLPNVRGETYLIAGRSGGPWLTDSVAVSVHPETFAVLAVGDLATAAPAERIAQAGRLIHYGHWAGAASRAIWVTLGLVATALAIYGTMIGLSRRGATGRGYWRGLWRALGIWRWAYLLAILAPPAAFMAGRLM